MKTLLLFLTISFTSYLMAQTGINWEGIGDVASSSYGNNYPRVVLDGSGNPVVTWGGGDKMMFARWNGSGFTTPDTISENGVNVASATWQGPDLASYGDTIYAIYKETPENVSTSGVWCVRSTDGGVTFSSPVQVNAYTADSLTRFPTITTDDNGHPIAAFMEFDPGFTDARWMVSKSTDLGVSFLPDVKASGWSSPTSEVCDCCPGSITSSGNNVIMMYRDNNSNERDSWAGISTDSGLTFTNGMNIDQKNWVLNSCPSSGPDGYIIGDSLYATFMNGQSGDYEVFYSSSHVPSATGGAGVELDPISPGDIQNYPRLSNSGTKVVYVWRENSNGTTKALLRFSNDITNGLPNAVDTIAMDYVVSCDVANSSTQVVVVWQDYNSGTVKYIIGTYAEVGINETPDLDVEVFPNPASTEWMISGEDLVEVGTYKLLDQSGRIIYQGAHNGTSNLTVECEKLPTGVYILQLDNQQVKLIKN